MSLRAILLTTAAVVLLSLNGSGVAFAKNGADDQQSDQADSHLEDSVPDAEDEPGDVADEPEVEDSPDDAADEPENEVEDAPGVEDEPENEVEDTPGTDDDSGTDVEDAPGDVENEPGDTGSEPADDNNDDAAAPPTFPVI